MIFLVLTLSSFALYAQEEKKQEVKETVIDPFSIENKFSIRLGVGYSLSLLDIDLDKKGNLGGAQGTLTNDSINEHTGHIATSIGFKYSPLNYFSIGISLDYHVVPVNDFDINITNGTTSYNVDSDNLGKIHVLSWYAFIEARYPIRISSGVLAPYAQAGIGGTATMDTLPSEFRLDNDITMGAFLAGGFEIFFFGKSNVSFFVESRWHYSYEDITFRPTENSEFEGVIELSNISFLVGVNIYM